MGATQGHIENGEKPAVTAVREVYEETGVWARPLNYSEVKEFKTPNESY
jgi:8-oxo-dGTP pyrophosphatase MutT (NUDIX family)